MRRITRSAVIAGGYPRDIILGAKPKDIDIFIDSRYYPTEESRDTVTERLYRAFGQIGVNQKVLRQSDEEGYDNHVALGLPEAFHLYRAITSEREWEPLNIIFSPGNARVRSFDWSVCNFQITDGEIQYNPRDADLSQITYIGPVIVENFNLTISHALRIKEKYPEAIFRVTPSMLIEYPRVYRAFLKGGLFGEYTRSHVPTQGEIFTRDEIRQSARARLGGRPVRTLAEIAAELEQERRAAERERAINAWAATQVPNWNLFEFDDNLTREHVVVTYGDETRTPF